ncbi:MAG TPA: right-handed parallel beta-helix repeat-containing protein, partial [Pyrinomonadaceae bacterium]|nr:right-handed parallel beta-helix repeat-containing protein [Pyrinomonadaceae bacterium]
LTGAVLPRAAAAPSVPVVNVEAADAQAAEPGVDNGSFTVSRSRVTSKPLTVFYTLGGGATAGSDYAPLTGSVIIPANAASAAVTISPLDDQLVEGAEATVLSIKPQSAYVLGADATAAVSIADDDPEAPPGGTVPSAAPSIYVSTRGNDTGDGATPETALRSISAAAARAVPGTTVYVEGGTYFEQVVTKAGGLEGLEIVFRSFNGTAVIDGSTQAWAPGGNQNQGLVELRHPYVRLAGLRVINSKNTGVLLDADHLTVEGCEVGESQRHGISTHTSRQTNYPGLAGTMIRNTVLRGNVVWRAALAGRAQAVSLIADGFLVSGNTVRDNATEGIDIWLGAKHGEVSGNTVHGNKAPGIYVDGASFVRIHSNRVFNNSKGVGVSSEDVNYPTHDVWVYNNVVYDNTGAGVFVWDDGSSPGFKGSQNVLIAHNTLVGNSPSVYLSGDSNSAQIMNNLGQTSGATIYSSATNSAFNTHNNVWLRSLTGFADAANKDFRLTAASPALDRGSAVPYFYDDLGNAFTISTDFGGLSRPSGAAPDAGAYEYR